MFRTTEFIDSNEAEGGGVTVTCYTEDGEAVDIASGIAEAEAASIVDGVRAALSTWRGWTL